MGGGFEPEARRKGIELRLAVADELPRRIVGDPGRLRQVLAILVDNALKFTPAGSVDVRVRSGAGPGRVAFAVTDTGIGVPGEARERIFRPFEQADDATTRRYCGTGLGLAIASQLVRQMGGQIALESAPGEGSTFAFELDLPAAEDEPRPADAALPGSRTVPSGLRVLVVDDSPVNLRLAARLVEREGHLPTTAEDGRQALEVLAATPIDLVLMDVQMPIMDGLEATREWRRRERASGGHVPVIALTARGFPEDRTRCLAAGMDYYLAKPVLRAQLDVAIAEVFASAV